MAAMATSVSELRAGVDALPSILIITGLVSLAIHIEVNKQRSVQGEYEIGVV